MRREEPRWPVTAAPGSPVQPGTRQGAGFFPRSPSFLLTPYHSHSVRHSGLREPGHGAPGPAAALQRRPRAGRGCGGRGGGNGRIPATHPLPVLPAPLTERLLPVPAAAVTEHLGRLMRSRETQCGTSPRGAWSGRPNRATRPAGRPLPSPASAEPRLDSLALSSGMRFLCTLRGTDDAQKTHTLNLTGTTRWRSYPESLEAHRSECSVTPATHSSQHTRRKNCARSSNSSLL